MIDHDFSLVMRGGRRVASCTHCEYETYPDLEASQRHHLGECPGLGRALPPEYIPDKFVGHMPIEKITDVMEPLEARTKTRENKATIIIDLAEGKNAAEFLEFVANAIRERHQLRITVE